MENARGIKYALKPRGYGPPDQLLADILHLED
jgi:hypothetical protein